MNTLFIFLAFAGLIAAIVAMVKDPRNIFIYVAAAALALIVLYRRLKVLRANKMYLVKEKLKLVDSEDILNEALEADVAVLYKHSTRCPVSANVYQEVVKFAGRNQDVPVYFLKVIEQRALSDKVASLFKVEHKSPQIFVIRKGTQVWHASHYDITAGNLQEQF